MIEKILQKLYDEYYPDRDIQVLIVNGRVTLAINDTAQASYSIKGTYRYEEVQNLNQFTNGFVQYGLCPGDGPTAIIGLADPNANLKFILDASPYGKMPNTHSMIFNRYSDEDAKQVSNYTVYGLNGLLELADIVKFDKIHFSYDARYQEAVISQEPRVLKMNCKFDRFHYSYRECKYFATHQPYFEISNSVCSWWMRAFSAGRRWRRSPGAVRRTGWIMAFCMKTGGRFCTKLTNASWGCPTGPFTSSSSASRIGSRTMPSLWP